MQGACACGAVVAVCVAVGVLAVPIFSLSVFLCSAVAILAQASKRDGVINI